MDYRVELDAFSGPLDLLLYLVRRQEVDILNLPIAQITARFLEFLEVLQILDLDLVGDFLVMASSLVEIKSRLALPGPEVPPELVEADEDPRADLVRQLLEYKRFKDASRLLEDQAAEWQQRYPRLSDDRPRGGNDPARDLIKEVELWDRRLHGTDQRPRSRRTMRRLQRILRGDEFAQPDRGNFSGSAGALAAL
jgi:segregation and condensation protein A